MPISLDARKSINQLEGLFSSSWVPWGPHKTDQQKSEIDNLKTAAARGDVNIVEILGCFEDIKNRLEMANETSSDYYKIVNKFYTDHKEEYRFHASTLKDRQAQRREVKAEVAPTSPSESAERKRKREEFEKLKAKGIDAKYREAKERSRPNALLRSSSERALLQPEAELTTATQDLMVREKAMLRDRPAGGISQAQSQHLGVATSVIEMNMDKKKQVAKSQVYDRLQKRLDDISSEAKSKLSSPERDKLTTEIIRLKADLEAKLIKAPLPGPSPETRVNAEIKGLDGIFTQIKGKCDPDARNAFQSEINSIKEDWAALLKNPQKKLYAKLLSKLANLQRIPHGPGIDYAKDIKPIEELTGKIEKAMSEFMKDPSSHQDKDQAARYQRTGVLDDHARMDRLINDINVDPNAYKEPAFNSLCQEVSNALKDASKLVAQIDGMNQGLTDRLAAEHEQAHPQLQGQTSIRPPSP